MFWRLKSKVILLIILETIDFIVKSIFIVGVCKIGPSDLAKRSATVFRYLGDR